MYNLLYKVLAYGFFILVEWYQDSHATDQE
jgi:hypothetical protein